MIAASARRVVLVGGPCRGKSTLARSIGLPILCTDSGDEATTMLPPGLDWSATSRYVANRWLTLPGPWCCEGIVTARALRKLAADGKAGYLADAEIMILRDAKAPTTMRQEACARGVMTAWRQIAWCYPQAVEV